MLRPQYEDRLEQASTLPVAIGQSPAANSGLPEFVRSWISPGICFAVGGASFIGHKQLQVAEAPLPEQLLKARHSSQLHCRGFTSTHVTLGSSIALC